MAWRFWRSSPRPAVEVWRFEDLEALCRAGSAFVRELARVTLARKDAFHMACGGGCAVRRLCELLPQSGVQAAVDWSRVRVFFCEERCVPLEDPESTRAMLREAFLERVDIPPGNVRHIPCELGAARAAATYEAELAAVFGAGPKPPALDLVVLGVGTDGAVAALAPGDPALAETRRWVVPVRAATTIQGSTLGETSGATSERVTLTLPVLNAAKAVMVLATGADKAQAVATCLAGNAATASALPAALLRPVGRLVWLVDQEAGQGL